MTLGISTNTRLVGMAIIDRGELITYGVRLHKSPWTPAKASQIITTLEPCVRQYSINRVVLSIPPKHRQTSEFLYLTQQLQSFFLSNNVEVLLQSTQELQAFLKEKSRKTKKKIMRAIAERFPELKLFYDREIRNKHRYYFKLFEAVGMSILFAED